MQRRTANSIVIIAACFVASTAYAQTADPPPAPTAAPAPATAAPPPPAAGAPAAAAKPSNELARVRAACGNDVQRLCASVPKGNGQVVKCLVSHQHETSPTCQAYLREVRAKHAATSQSAAYGGAARQPAPAPAAAVAPAPAAAKPAAAAPPIRAACGNDVQRFCASVPKGNGEVVKCLATHHAEISPSCQAFLQQARTKHAAATPPAAAPAPTPAPAVAPAAAKPAATSAPPIRAACGNDVQRFCASVPKGNGEVVKCLAAHHAEISPSCQAFLQQARTKHAAATQDAAFSGARQPAAAAPAPAPAAAKPAAAGAPPIRAACGQDVQRFCASVPKGNGEVVKCLATHHAEISPSCVTFLREARARAAAKRSAQPSAPAQPGAQPAAQPMAQPPASPADDVTPGAADTPAR